MKTKKEEIEFPKLVSNNENYMDAFRYNVGVLRNYYGWSVRMLAEKADLSADTLNGFLKGTSKDCNLVTAIKLARAFNISIDELVGAETIEKETRECIAMSRNLPDYVRYLNKSFIKHQYKLHNEFDKDAKPIPVYTPQCVNGYLKTTNLIRYVDINHLTNNLKSKICAGIQIPCEHYEPYYMPNEIVLLSADRAGLNQERCVVTYKGNYFFAIKRIDIVDGEKKVKYLSMMGSNLEILPSDIDDKLGYVVGFLNPDESWGVR